MTRLSKYTSTYFSHGRYGVLGSGSQVLPWSTDSEQLRRECGILITQQAGQVGDGVQPRATHTGEGQAWDSQDRALNPHSTPDLSSLEDCRRDGAANASTQ